MTDKPKGGNIFDDDDLDDAIINADDTGMVGTQHQIIEEEIANPEEGPASP